MPTFKQKLLNLEMNWVRSLFSCLVYCMHTEIAQEDFLQGNRRNFSESVRNSISVHCKINNGMVFWLKKTVAILKSAGCSEQSCKNADVKLLHDKLHNWSSHKVQEWDLTWDNFIAEEQAKYSS